jgi:DNA polymerase-3 subunit gamma/tau
VDHLITEGHNPTHFARQMVRFLRNATVAKVAGSDSSLLQISGDERTRVARVADLFSEEDLTRHLQIILRTHGELGYRQEQRFHLELGLLKMTHAQRLLPLEQLLSSASVSAAGSARPALKPSVVSEIRRPEANPAPRSNHVSPFDADSARKGGSKPQLSTENISSPPPRSFSMGTERIQVVMGSTVTSVLEAPPQVEKEINEIPLAIHEVPEKEAVSRPDTAVQPEHSSNGASSINALREAVLNALASNGHRMVVSMMESDEWRTEGNELIVKVTSSPTVIDMSLGADAKKLVIATASGVMGRPLRLKVVPGAAAAGGTSLPRVPPSPGSGRSRAEQDPVVRRMKEKFGAEIRTIIDYRDKR